MFKKIAFDQYQYVDWYKYLNHHLSSTFFVQEDILMLLWKKNLVKPDPICR